MVSCMDGAASCMENGLHGKWVAWKGGCMEGGLHGRWVACMGAAWNGKLDMGGMHSGLHG
jgi:hypothetical protein